MKVLYIVLSVHIFQHAHSADVISDPHSFNKLLQLLPVKGFRENVCHLVAGRALLDFDISVFVPLADEVIAYRNVLSALVKFGILD